MNQASRPQRARLNRCHPLLLPYCAFSGGAEPPGRQLCPKRVPLYREGVSICEKNYGPESACAAELLGALGTALAHDGNFTEAEATLHRSLSLCDRNFGPGSSARGSMLNGLAIVLLYTGRYGEAEAVLREALDINRRRPNPENGEVGATLNNLGALYELTGQYKKSEAALRQSVAIDEKVAGPDSELTIINTLGLATVLRKSGQYKEAEAIARRTVTAAERSLGPERQDHPALGGALGVLASILRETGRYAEAESLYRKELADTKQYLGPDHPDVAGTEADLAGVLHLAGQDEEALSLLKHAKVAADMSGSQMLQWQVASALMQVYASGKFANPVKAIFYGKEAVNDLQKVRANMSSSSRETQESFVSTAEVSGVYRTLAGLMITDGRPKEAQQIPRDGQGAGILRVHSAIIALGRAKDGRHPQLERRKRRLDELNEGKCPSASAKSTEPCRRNTGRRAINSAPPTMPGWSNCAKHGMRLRRSSRRMPRRLQKPRMTPRRSGDAGWRSRISAERFKARSRTWATMPSSPNTSFWTTRWRFSWSLPMQWCRGNRRSGGGICTRRFALFEKP